MFGTRNDEAATDQSMTIIAEVEDSDHNNDSGDGETKRKKPRKFQRQWKSSL